MNDFQTKLYNDLTHLVETNEAFLTKIQKLDDVEYQVFDYRLATYSDFLLPNARESRGIMFELDADRKPNRLACFMPQKFFNYGEGDTLKLDISDANIAGVMDKLDGSIISTFMHKGELRLKSKTSLHSDHVKQATRWLDSQPGFKLVLANITEAGFSVHMELTSPDLRIVVGYGEVRLTILSMREVATGKMVNKRTVTGDGDLSIGLAMLIDHWVKDLPAPLFAKSANPFEKIERPGPGPYPTDTTHVADFIKSVKAMTGVEGYIVRLKCGEHLKIKCDWYCALHHTKDSVSAPRRLFECVVNGGSDDLKGMFGDDQITIARIEEMEDKVKTTYNRIMKTVEDFYETNKELSRKDYAILANKADDSLMALKMNLYLGKGNDYKEFSLKHMEMFGVNVHQVYETAEE